MSQMIEYRHSPHIAALSKQTPGTAVLPSVTVPPPPKKEPKHVTIRPSRPAILPLRMLENVVKAVTPTRRTLSSPIICGFPEQYVDRLGPVSFHAAWVSNFVVTSENGSGRLRCRRQARPVPA
ncbi:hypothetical protein BS47DRAFT_1399381 [Hydnum rufescens UP504]|uniref:Uncharacterized protein n=1 Tax=Hydnum rufescens UP504 TaxID=1448309 RepID=A0A9P6AJJ8_9AGAM|nr:hypothetical protein BS47DRAFT_1399381 [Hydnum rufescens UP504]